MLPPDLPAWLQAALGRAIAIDATNRFRDMTEFAVEMEMGPAPTPPAVRRPRTLYERAPLRFWQGVWVGGMFAIYVCLRPALVTIERAPRLRLMLATLGNFFPWVWISALLLVATGYGMKEEAPLLS